MPSFTVFDKLKFKNFLLFKKLKISINTVMNGATDYLIFVSGAHTCAIV
jgi:hypothetical protein